MQSVWFLLSHLVTGQPPALGKFNPGGCRGGTDRRERKEGVKMPLSGTGRRVRTNLPNQQAAGDRILDTCRNMEENAKMCKRGHSS